MYPFYLQNVSKFCIYILKHSIFNCKIFQKIWEHTTFTFYKTQGHFISLPVSFDHRRRMEREGKAKVVASIWGANCVQFLAMLAVLPRWILMKQLNSNRHYDLPCLAFCFRPSSMALTLINHIICKTMQYSIQTIMPYKNYIFEVKFNNSAEV